MGLLLCILSIQSQMQIPFLACLSPLSSNKVPVNPKQSIKQKSNKSTVCLKVWYMQQMKSGIFITALNQPCTCKAKDRKTSYYMETSPSGVKTLAKVSPSIQQAKRLSANLHSTSAPRFTEGCAKRHSTHFSRENGRTQELM